MRYVLCAVVLLIAMQAGSRSQSRVDSSSTPVVKPAMPFDIRAAIERSARGELDPFDVLPHVIARRDSAVQILSEIVNAEASSLPTGAGIRTDPTGRRARIYALQCLEGIGTVEAFEAVFAIASTHVDRELQALALRGLAVGFYRGSYQDIMTPDKKLLHLFLMNVDDTTHVAQLGATVGSIARQGVVNWFGQDPGEPRGSGFLVKESTKYSTVSASGRRTLWWNAYSGRIRWNAQQRVFELR